MKNNLDIKFVKLCTTKEHRKDLPFIQEYLFETDRSHFCKNQKKSLRKYSAVLEKLSCINGPLKESTICLENP